MLQTQAVSPALLELLKAIMASPVFTNFLLVGGTALALQEGHRFSEDIDLFGPSKLDELEITNELQKIGNTVIISKSSSILIYKVNTVKVDFVSYPYKWIDSEVSSEGFRIASKKEIAAMKLNAIAGRGSKKDFIDLYYLLNSFSLTQMIEFFKEKYPDGSEFLVIKSLNYFEDADGQDMPEMLQSIGWDEIKEGIRRHVKEVF